MDQDFLVDERIEAGSTLIAELIRKGFDVGGACWAKRSDSGRWSLYIITKTELSTRIEAFRTLYEVLERVASPTISPIEVKLIGPDQALSKALAKIGERFPVRSTIRDHGEGFSEAGVDEAYIYPSPGNPISPNGLIRAFFDLPKRRELNVPPLVILRDGTKWDAILTGFSMNEGEGVTVRLKDAVTLAERSIHASEIASIL